MSGYTFDPAIIWQNLPFLLGGLLLTLLEVSLDRSSRRARDRDRGRRRSKFRLPVLNGIVRTYVEFIRNTPFLVQLFFLYFALPNLAYD